jgi:hypothetical protein
MWAKTSSGLRAISTDVAIDAIADVLRAMREALDLRSAILELGG